MLYIIGTPIGNLEDISLRALRLLQEVDYIFAEDTRHTRKLLTHYDIHKPLRSYHEHNEKSSSENILSLLSDGKDIALVSDAGMPGISDPGSVVMQLISENGLAYTVVPGPNAAITALLLSALPSERFAYEGFLPRSGKERQNRMEQLCLEERSIIIYESPLRICNTLEDLLAAFGDRPAALCRELTKLNENVYRGTIQSLLEVFRTDAPRGECVLVIAGAHIEEESPDEEQLLRAMKNLVEGQKIRAKDAAKQLATPTIRANAIYQLYLESQQNS